MQGMSHVMPSSYEEYEEIIVRLEREHGAQGCSTSLVDTNGQKYRKSTGSPVTFGVCLL